MLFAHVKSWMSFEGPQYTMMEQLDVPEDIRFKAD
jgi:hypothetical protein